MYVRPKVHAKLRDPASDQRRPVLRRPGLLQELATIAVVLLLNKVPVSGTGGAVMAVPSTSRPDPHRGQGADVALGCRRAEVGRVRPAFALDRGVTAPVVGRRLDSCLLVPHNGDALACR